MAGIEELINPAGPNQTTYNANYAASVQKVDGDQITVTVASFAQGKQVYATVPFGKKSSGDPSPGDPAVLHSDSNGNPLYAYVLS